MNTPTTPKTATLLSLALAGLIVLPSCEDKTPPEKATRETPQSVLGGAAKMAKDVKSAIQAQDQQTQAMADAISAAPGDFTSIGGLRFKIPEGWTKQEAGGMRLAQYVFTGPDGPADVVFFGIRGSASDNIARWKRQVTADPGVNPVVRERSLTAGNLKITYVILEGTFTGMTAAGQPAPPKPGTRFFGGYIEVPGADPVQIRVTGPVATVQPMEAAIEAMLSGALTP